jgi:hypothetical protein
LAIDSTVTASTTRFDQGVHSDGADTGQLLTADGSGGSSWEDFAIDLSLHSYTPVITGSVSDPNIGLSGSISAAYIQLGKFIHCSGQVFFEGTSRSAGSGDWLITVPVAVTGPRRDINGQAYLTNNEAGIGARTEWRGLEVNVLDTNMCFVYADPAPVGTRTILGSASVGGSPWTFTDGDRLHFRFSYFTD